MSQTIINWAKLTKENRVKAPGISWTDEEREAIRKGMSPDDVRAGFLTKKAVAQSKKEGKKIENMTKAEIADIARGLGIDFDETVISRGDLILEVKKAEAKKSKPK